MPRNYESYKQSGGGGYTGVWTPPNGKASFNATPGWRYKQKMRNDFKHQATEDWANKSFPNNQQQGNQQQNRQKQQEYYRSFNPPKPPGATWSTGSPRSAPPKFSPRNESTPNGFHQPKPPNGTDNWFRDRFDNFD